MPLTVGSIGDIIALAQLAGKLYKALSASQGAAADFRDVVLELSAFYGALESLLVLYPTRPNLEGLISIVAPVVNECKDVIEGFLEKIVRRYGRRLGGGVGGSASKKGFKEMGRMLQWHIFETDAVAKLREKVGRANGVAQLVLMQAQAGAAEHDRRVVSEKLAALSALEAAAKEDLNRHIVEMRESIENQNLVLGNHTVMLEKVSSDMRSVVAAVTPMTEAAFDMKNMLVQVQDILLPQGGIPRNLTPWLQNALFLEDSLGYTLPVPLETISSWQTLHAVLCDKFKDRPGYELVKRRQYLFQDGGSSRDLNIKMQLSVAVRPGQKVNMSMVIFSPRSGANICPRCRTVTIAKGSRDVECSNPACQMIYRRVIDVTNVFSQDDKKATFNLAAAEDSLSFDDCDITDSIPTKLFIQEKADDSPDVFKRVRLFTRWQDADESRSPEPLYQFGCVSLWESRGPAEQISYQIRSLVFRAIADALSNDDGFNDAVFNSGPGFCDVVTSQLFIGTSRQKAKPAVFVYAKHKRVRQKALEILRRQNWLDSTKSPLMITSWYNQSIREHLIERFVSNGDDREELEEAF